MSALVCDASVIVKLLVAEPDSPQAVALADKYRIIVPDFARLEVGNTLWFRVHAGECGLDEALRLLTDLEGLGIELQSISPFVARALTIAGTIDHPIYDCIYLALAESLDIPLVTADQRFLGVLRRVDFLSVDVRALAEVG